MLVAWRARRSRAAPAGRSPAAATKAPKPSRVQARRHGLRARRCAPRRRRRRGVPARAVTRRSMSTNRPESGRFDQVVSAVTWKSTIRPSPRLSAVTIGRAVGERRPGLAPAGRRRARPGSGGGCRSPPAPARPKNGLSRVNGAKRLRRVPGQRAAEVAPAAAQAHGHEVVVAGGEPRAGEAQQQAALLDEGRDLARGSRGRGRRHRRGRAPRPARR